MSRSDNPDKDLPFIVEALLQDGTHYRFISKNVNIYVARAAFHMAMIQYPNDRLRLKHGSLVVADTRRKEPESVLQDAESFKDSGA